MGNPQNVDPLLSDYLKLVDRGDCEVEVEECLQMYVKEVLLCL